MKDTLSDIVEMLEVGSPEQRVAAAQVLAWLKPKTPLAAKALGLVAGGGEAYLRPYAVEALGAIANPTAMAFLIPLLHQDGPLRNKVVRVFSRKGSASESVLLREFDKAERDTKGVILEILAITRGSDGMALLIKCIKDPEETQLAHVAGRALFTEAQSLQTDSEEGQKARDRLRSAFLQGLKSVGRRVLPSAKATLVKLLSQVKDDASRTVLINNSSPTQAPEVRQAALQGLQGMVLTEAQVAKVLSFLKEEDFLHVAGPALELLENVVPQGASMATALARLLDNPRPEVKLFALKMLGSFSTPTLATAKLLLPFLASGDPQVHHLASVGLASNPEACDGLVTMFLAARDLEEAGRPFDAIAGVAPMLGQTHLRELVLRFMSLLEAADPVRDIYLNVLSKANPDLVGPLLLGAAKKLRIARRFPEAIRVLQTVSSARDGVLSGDARYELAIVTLLQRALDSKLAEGDPVIGHFCHLIKENYDLLGTIQNERMLSVDQVLYVGQRFVERLNEERRFGAQLLNWLIQKEPEAKASVQAMQKLKVEGLA